MKLKRYLRQYFAHKPRPRIWRAFNNYFHWRKGLSLPLSPLQLGIPWLNFNAADFILQKMSPLQQIAEYGSGGSTLFFCGRIVWWSRWNMTPVGSGPWNWLSGPRDIKGDGLVFTRPLLLFPGAPTMTMKIRTVIFPAKVVI